MANFKVNLCQGLTEDMFQVHEEVLDEKHLFQFHVLCDKIMNTNPQAKHDGCFKIMLPDSLRGTGSSLKEFWEKFGNAPQYLSSLYLTGDKHSPGVMKHHGRRVSHLHGAEFKKAVKDPQTFDTSRRNCCMQALDKGGPKAAVIHFYECILSKAIFNDTKTPETLKSCKSQYEKRQMMLVEDDPSLTCVRIERNMKDRKYSVQENTASLASTGTTSNDHDPILSAFVPIGVKQDGDGDNCSLYFTCIEENSDNFLYVTSNFALSHLCHLNMLTDLPEYFSGIAFPFLYLGGLHSVFPLHIEDMSLWSINFNHFGYPKLVIIIAPSEVSRLSLLLTTYGLSWTGKDCIQQLYHKSDIVFPQWLLEHGIKFKVVVQHPGEFIVFAPNAAHTGGNFGPNLAEACNFGSYDWLPFGSVASHGRCDCIDKGVQFDVTPLIMDHRKELLPYHVDKTMWTCFKDDHFQSSLIIPPTACYSSCNMAVSTKPPQSVRVPCKSEGSNRHWICPIKGCNKVFKSGLKKLVAHVNQRHSDVANDDAVKKCLANM